MNTLTLNTLPQQYPLERGRDESRKAGTSLRLYPNKDKSFENEDTHFGTIQIYRNR